jgi:hypothetical protein
MKNAIIEAFISNPQVNKLYTTSDECCFTSEDVATVHANSLGKTEEQRKVVTTLRKDVEKDINAFEPGQKDTKKTPKS